MERIKASQGDAYYWQRNLVLLRCIAFFQFAFVVVPVIVPLLQGYGLSMTQILLLGSVFSVSTVVLEVPSVIFADRYGRYMAVLVGGLCVGLGFTVLFFARAFVWLCLFELLVAIGFSLISGADTSLAFESEKALGRPAGAELTKIQTWTSWGEAAAAVACTVVLLFGDMQVLLGLQLLIGWLVFGCALFLREPAEQGADLSLRRHTMSLLEIAHPKVLWSQFRAIPNIGLLLLFYLGISAWTYYSFWLMQPLMRHHGVPEVWFGLVFAVMHLSVGTAARYVPAFRLKLARTTIQLLLPGMVLFGFVLFQVPWVGAAILGGVVSSLVRGFVVPLFKISVNEQVEDNRRATLNSMLAVVFRLMTAVCGPLVGLSVDYWSVYPTAALLLVFIVPGVAGLVVWQVRLKQGQCPPAKTSSAMLS